MSENFQKKVIWSNFTKLQPKILRLNVCACVFACACVSMLVFVCDFVIVREIMKVYIVSVR